MGLLLWRWRLLGRVGVGMVLLRVVAAVLHWGWMQGQHRGWPVALCPGLLSP